LIFYCQKYIFIVLGLPGRLPWHHAWDLRVWGLSPGTSRQPLTLGCQKQQEYSQPYSVPLMIDFSRHTLKESQYLKAKGRVVTELQKFKSKP